MVPSYGSTISFSHFHMGDYQLGYPNDPDRNLQFTQIDYGLNVVWTASLYNEINPYSVNSHVDYIDFVGANRIISETGMSIWAQRPAL